MAEKQLCSVCNGSKTVEVLVSAHDTKKENSTCFKCNGIGFIFVASQQDEDDYRSSMDDW